MAAKMGGIRGRPSIVRKDRRRVSVFDFLDEKMNQLGGAAGLTASGPRLEYRLR
jgi:hypothetical protein